ncbi:MAG: hypothetical protein IT577_22680 [Verrucomicrobiae bacterium]|nr:hypothetical protein [Verrucomicrobiae bacterium]
MKMPTCIKVSLAAFALGWMGFGKVHMCFAEPPGRPSSDEYTKGLANQSAEEIGKTGGPAIVEAVKNSSQLDVSGMSAKESAAAFAKQESLFSKLGTVLKNIDLVGPIAKIAGEWSVNSTGAKFTLLDEGGKKLAGAAGGAMGAVVGGAMAGGHPAGAIAGGVIAGSAVQTKYEQTVSPGLMDAALAAQTREQQLRDYRAGGHYWRYELLQEYKTKYGPEEGRVRWQQDYGLSGAPPAKPPAKSEGTASGQGDSKHEHDSAAHSPVRDNVRDTAQEIVRDAVTTTVKDGVHDNVKDTVTTTVKDTCADNCKDGVRGNARDNVRSSTSGNARDNCRGGANCR